MERHAARAIPSGTSAWRLWQRGVEAGADAAGARLIGPIADAADDADITAVHDPDYLALLDDA